VIGEAASSAGGGVALVVRAASPLATVQDLGRIGWQRFGVSVGGAMDAASLIAANVLAGNPPGTAAVEFTLDGGEWELAGATGCRVAVAGGAFAVAVDGRPVAPWRSLTLHEGSRLRIGPAPDALRGYLAVAGGFAVAPQLGSAATHVRTGIGGLDGRALRAGDALPLAASGGAASAPAGPDRTLGPAAALPLRTLPVRVVLGPQDDYFTDEAVATFLGGDYAVSREADRMGYRLDGPRLAHRDGYNIVSDGIAAGSIQVPGSGQPIVLLADRQTTGGYPKIATVITPDLATVAQSRPGDRLRFAAVPLAEAHAIHRAWRSLLAGLAERLTPVRGDLDSETLLKKNLIGGVVDARRG
jgi:biotin-dependent carboxylase-like uncharacterized protein